MLPQNVVQLPDRHARAKLPYVPRVGRADSAEQSARRDLDYLYRQGLVEERFALQRLPDGRVIPDPSYVDYVEGCALLDSTGQRGVYEAFVRREGVVHSCPEWCTAEDHPRAAIYDPRDEGPVHESAARELVGTTGPDARVYFCSMGDDDPSVWVEDLEVSPAQARDLAAALLRVAAACERVTP